MFKEIKIDSLSLLHADLLNLSSVFSEEKGTCLFFSGGAYETAKKSHLCLFPPESAWIEERKTYHLKPGNDKPEISRFDDPWDGLKNIISNVDSNLSSTPDWVGYLGYEIGAFSDPEKQIPYQPSPIPDAYFLRPTVVLSVDHTSGLSTLYTREEGLFYLSMDQKKFIQLLSTPKGIQELIDKGKENNKIPFETNLSLHRPIENPDKYKQKIEEAKELIREGEIYQVNLSQQFQLKGDFNPFRIFQKVSTINPAPFMGYFHFPEFSLVSSSPERFLCKRGERLETRPIKGTVPRGKTPEQDSINKNELLTSPKEKAELLMITDLMRNDLGKVSQTGSVVTDSIWHCEAYTNVYHLISIIHSKAKPNQHPVDILRKTFPGGSITGCPKLRAMEVIHDLEKRPRGIYTGSIGYFSANGDFDFNIAIRTILCKDGLLDIQLGGAIVADSVPQKEYEEALHKGTSIFKTLEIEDHFSVYTY